MRQREFITLAGSAVAAWPPAARAAAGDAVIGVLTLAPPGDGPNDRAAHLFAAFRHGLAEAAANAMGVTVPHALLVRADKVIE